MAICTECGEEFDAPSIFNTICENCEEELDDDEEVEDFDDEDDE